MASLSGRRRDLLVCGALTPEEAWFPFVISSKVI